MLYGMNYEVYPFIISIQQKKQNYFMYKKIFFLALILTMGAQITQAQFRPYSNEFLALGVGARGLAMGNAQTALV